MWTHENRPKYNRDHLRYPSDLTDDEWAYVEPLIPPAKPAIFQRIFHRAARLCGWTQASKREWLSDGGTDRRPRAYSMLSGRITSSCYGDCAFAVHHLASFRSSVRFAHMAM